MWFTSRSKLALPTPESALPGRSTRLPVSARHFVLDTPIEPPNPAGLQEVILGLGCFWGAERMFWKLDGVYTTEVGYAGGFTPNPTYEEVCSGRTGHTEVVRVVFDPTVITLGAILRVFWEGHDPTQGMRQGNDVGTQYRSAIYTSGAQASGDRPGHPRRIRHGACSGRTRRDHHRDRPRRASSTRPRTTTSSIWPRCPTAIAGSAVRE